MNIFHKIKALGLQQYINDYSNQFLDISFVQQTAVPGILLSQRYSLELLALSTNNGSMEARECELVNSFLRSLEFVCCIFSTKKSFLKFTNTFISSHWHTEIINIEYDYPCFDCEDSIHSDAIKPNCRYERTTADKSYFWG